MKNTALPVNYNSYIYKTSIEVSQYGKYFPTRSLMKPSDIPLNLHIIGETQEQLDKAVEKIKELTAKIIKPVIGGIKMFGSPYLVI